VSRKSVNSARYFFTVLRDTPVSAATCRLLLPWAYRRKICRSLIMKIVLLAMSVVGWFNFQLPTIQATKTTFLTAPIQVGQLRAKMVGQFETKRVDLFPAKRVDQLQRFLHPTSRFLKLKFHFRTFKPKNK